MDTHLKLSEAGLREKADELRTSMSKLSDALRQTAALVSLVRDTTDPRYVDTLFATRANISAGDVRILAELAPFLERSGDALRAASPFTIKAMADAREDVREEALHLLASSRTVDIERLEQIRSHLDRTAFGDSRAFHDVREVALESFASDRVPERLQAIASLADDLIYSLEGFRRQYVPRPDEGDAMLTHDSEYAGDHRAIVKQAKNLLAEVERVLGNEESLAELDEKEWTVRALRRSHRALRRLAAGRFGHDGGFAFEVGPYAIFSTEIPDALHFLANVPEGVDEVRGRVTSPPRKLNVLELCAGAGGQAIGLMAAGFDHRAMYELNGKRVRTLEKNWMQWKVMRRDIRDVPTEELEKYRGIDLLAGGPPCKPFSQANTAGNRSSRHNLFSEMIRAVRAIRPRAFMFENVPGLEAGDNATYLAGICTDLVHSRPGYRVDLVRLDAANYGLPQSRSRLVIVGIRKDEPGELTEPVLVPVEGYVADVLGPAIIRYETPDHLKDSIPTDSDQWVYDRWAEHWRSEHASSVLPAITATRTETRSDRLGKWRDKGFDVSSITDSPPAVGEVDSIDFKPRLTVEALARAQGFPPGWNFHAAISGNIAMIADAFPPVMAKDVGMRIYSALTGTAFDRSRALAEPVIDEQQIGRAPARPLLRRRRPADRTTKSELVLRGEPIEMVEPDPQAREMLQELVERIRVGNEWEREQDQLWDAHLFPDGLP